MANVGNTQPPVKNYDSRWFIWTIVFLVVTGISLVSYIVLSDSGTYDTGPIVVAHHKTVTENGSK
ncbi:MAG: hypothetical protein P4L74_01660 [Candidatus Doudnabacteria bacterium]|nr:hypothetical protein [Candidatus Doudnabacteria bacterium]